MMTETVLKKSTQQLLRDPLLGGQNVDTTIRRLLKAEYLRNLSRYRRTDRNLSQKYGMPFETFISSRMVQQREYTWDVESDAMDWEAAIGGIKTVERKLEALQAE